MSSNAFEEFVQKRIEEIIVEDEECRIINEKILSIEKEFVPYLPAELKKKILEIDELSFTLMNRACLLATDKITINR